MIGILDIDRKFATRWISFSLAPIGTIKVCPYVGQIFPFLLSQYL